jgi:predicted transcriptional regulator
VRGLPHCILEAKEKHTEMGLLLADSEVQLQEVKKSFEIKKAAILQQLHELARQIKNTVVLFPRLLK